MSAIDRQRAIYLSALRGGGSSIPVDPELLKRKACARLSRAARNYLAGGAGAEQTMSANRSAFINYPPIIPRMLMDNDPPDVSINLPGVSASSPLLLAPIGVLELAHRDGDLAVARACRQAEVPMIVSTQASYAMEEIADRLQDQCWWYQLYWSSRDELTASLVQRAERAGARAIVLTLDTTQLGWRVRDLDDRHLPFLKGKGLANYLSDPVFQEIVDNYVEESPTPISWKGLVHLLKLCRKIPGNSWNHFRTRYPIRAVKCFTSMYTRRDLSWKHVSKLREMTNLPIYLKGILSPQDAQQAIEHEVDGIIVSNHGGRQVDGSISSLEALGRIRPSLGGSFPILLDSGIRSGTDVLTALRAGADAVLIGRPYAYALAIAGEQGVIDLLANYRAELELQMSLSGIDLA